ncbi:hypothetical protein PUR71_27925 [Streptomyces sp. SP17BM10]|uniref:Rv1733c family protein n=1 Tax=Streptomyces sp. SP17BM10 TaxID=3002530 RepID=UPI002E77DF17|nr:hypothetical protein [Streptomyces sp. SP17BM10]MEE1786701.1 hypothetical protein [Streptomyces sp. SP17BM10]
MAGSSAPVRSAAVAHPLRHHLHRAIGADDNPLSRPLDRKRSRALLLAVLGLVLAAVAGSGVSLAALASGQRAAAVTAAHRHRVSATLLAPAEQVAGLAGLSRVRFQATAAWTAPSGRPATGPVDVDRPLASGAVTRLWVDDDGHPAAAPPATADLVMDAVFLGLAGLAALGVLIGTALCIRLRRLDHWADRRWELSWARLEPVWSGRRTP